MSVVDPSTVEDINRIDGIAYSFALVKLGCSIFIELAKRRRAESLSDFMRAVLVRIEENTVSSHGFIPDNFSLGWDIGIAG